jgi:hypothetical protein
VDELDTLAGEWPRLDDDLALVRWRSERLVALGYELREASFLAISRVDIHELEWLIENGCPPATAVRIAA